MHDAALPSGSAGSAIARSLQRAFNPDTADMAVRVLATGAPSVDDAHPYDPNDGA